MSSFNKEGYQDKEYPKVGCRLALDLGPSGDVDWSPESNEALVSLLNIEKKNIVACILHNHCFNMTFALGFCAIRRGQRERRLRES